MVVVSCRCSLNEYYGTTIHLISFLCFFFFFLPQTTDVGIDILIDDTLLLILDDWKGSVYKLGRQKKKQQDGQAICQIPFDPFPTKGCTYSSKLLYFILFFLKLEPFPQSNA